MDAELNKLIKLRNPPPGPTERWQCLPTVTKNKQTRTQPFVATQDSPLRTRPPQNFSATPSSVAKTPGPRVKVIVQYNKTPGKHKTPCTSHSVKKRSPPKSGQKKTPGVRHGQTPSGCRFVPNRSTTDMDYSSYLANKKGTCEETSPGKEEYKQSLLNALTNSTQRGLLSFKEAGTSNPEAGSFLNSLQISSKKRRTKMKAKRRIPVGADKVLDAPSLINDYYTNTLDWGANNCLAIGLGSSVYLWNAEDGTVNQLMSMDSGEVWSVSWADNSKYLAVGESRGGASCNVQLWDVGKGKRVRVMKGHTDRVGVLTWNSHTIVSGSKDTSILFHDVRKQDHIIGRCQMHTGEVCGLKWSPNGRHLASGSNDCKVAIWSLQESHEPLNVLQGHQAAVKALAWCPWQSNLLSTGGGRNDKCIKLWNTSMGECIESVETKSQVSALLWNREYKELVSAHGEPSNQLTLWKYPSLCKVGELFGHDDRILNMSMSPESSMVATTGADETVRIWRCFEKSREHSLNLTEDSFSSIAISNGVR